MASHSSKLITDNGAVSTRHAVRIGFLVTTAGKGHDFRHDSRVEQLSEVTMLHIPRRPGRFMDRTIVQ